MSPHLNKHRICLIGAGFISNIHAEAINSLPNIIAKGIVDTNRAAAERVAAKWGIDHVFSNVGDAIASDNFDAYHVLVPPDAHAAVAAQCLKTGLPVFVEKPFATSAQQCEDLLALSQDHNAPLGVNQNFIYHPAFAKLRQIVEAGEVGPLESVECVYSMPLRQLSARQFGHWMFHEPKNILLEQAVHPLSQITTLTGPAAEHRTLAGVPAEISPGVLFYGQANVSFTSETIPAHLHFAVGREYPFWQVTALCKDGSVVADMISNRTFSYKRSRWLEAAEHMTSGIRIAGQIAGQSISNAGAYALSIAGLKARSDPFFISMCTSIRNFYHALESRQPILSDGAFGASLVRFCQAINDDAFPAQTAAAPLPASGSDNNYDILIIGGTGFIGRHVVTALIGSQKRVGVMARNLNNLSGVFYKENVTLVRGDATKEADLERAIAPARIVINLAHGGGGETWEEIRDALVGSARAVAEKCLAHKIDRLIHVGSIAGLYLGNSDETVTDATPPDPLAETRGDYARAKAEADRLLMSWHDTKNLPVCILRPGLVVGEGASPFHSGIGVYNNDQHCLGWNRGVNPLPFVLVEDVAQAMVEAVQRDQVIGGTYNLVGDVRLSASEYIEELARATRRPLQFHPQSLWKLQGVELAKWMIKRLSGRKVPLPSYRDLKSRGMTSTFDIEDTKRDLKWTPVADRQEFIRRAILVHP